jgi:hypothetical protein
MSTLNLRYCIESLCQLDLFMREKENVNMKTMNVERI